MKNKSLSKSFIPNILELLKYRVIKLIGELLFVLTILKKPEKDKRKETHINRVIKKRNGLTYVEIGVRSGDSFRLINCKRKIGIDPLPINFGDNLECGEQFFKKTSDSFFMEDAEILFKENRIDVALVDGLHEFKQALRDILNLEKYMSEKGVILVHDCNPPSRKHADIQDGGEWNGDVWKIACFLRLKRPDLTFFTLDCDWGVGFISNFKSINLISNEEEELITEIKSLDYSTLENNRQLILHLRPSVYSRIFLTLFKK